MDVRQFYQKVAQVRTGLPNVSSLFVTSTDAQEDGGKPGAVCEVQRELAAHIIAMRTHRISTAEEIAQFHADQKERGQKALETEMRNKQQQVVMMSPEASRAMADAYTGVQSAASGGDGRTRKQQGA